MSDILQFIFWVILLTVMIATCSEPKCQNKGPFYCAGVLYNSAVSEFQEAQQPGAEDE